MIDLTVIIPAYNEEAIVVQSLIAVRNWLRNEVFNLNWEILVVDDGSTDGTVTLAAKIATRVICNRHAGKAAAICAGLKAARGTISLITDMDLSTPISEGSKLLGYFLTFHDPVIVYGVRAKRSGAPITRKTLSVCQRLLRAMLFPGIGGMRIDTQCGFKAMRTVAGQGVIDHLRVYYPDGSTLINGPCVSSGFDVEILLSAEDLGYAVAFEPVEWRHHETRNVHVVRDAWRGTVDLFKIRSAWWGK